MTKLRLRKFQPKTCGGTGLRNHFILIIGKRNSGKTTLMKGLINDIKDQFNIVMAFSPTDDTNQALSGMMPPSLVHREINEALIKNLVDTQRRQWKPPHEGKHVLLILDDMAHERKFMDSKIFKELAFNSRHLKITLILTLQYSMACGPAIRANVDAVFTMAERMHANRKRLYDGFYGLMSFPEFNTVMDSATNNYEALVLYNRTTSNQLEDSLFWWKAPAPSELEGLRIVDDSFWRLDHHFRMSDETIIAHHRKHQQQKPGPINAVVTVDDSNQTIAERRVERAVTSRPRKAAGDDTDDDDDADEENAERDSYAYGRGGVDDDDNDNDDDDDDIFAFG